jgi:hypothetical protein
MLTTTTQVIVVWSALWYVLQWYNTLTYIDLECRKCLMHLVFLYIKNLMVWIFEFLQCAFVYNWIDLTHTMLLYCLIHFRFLKGYHTHTYIDSYCRKYLMHLYCCTSIAKLMVCLLNFALWLAAFVCNWIDLTHTMLLYCLIQFRFIKGMIWLRTLALLIVAAYW